MARRRWVGCSISTSATTTASSLNSDGSDRRVIATSRLSTDGAEFFGLPQDRTLIEGSRIEV
jgi:hypothetical protein